jgi:hypothetical protein
VAPHKTDRALSILQQFSGRLFGVARRRPILQQHGRDAERVEIPAHLRSLVLDDVILQTARLAKSGVNMLRLHTPDAR